jgi:hypothetical protein
MSYFKYLTRELRVPIQLNIDSLNPPAQVEAYDPKKDSYYQFKDTRPEATERSNFSGWYSMWQAKRLAEAAKKRGLDPDLVLAMAMAETNQGTRGYKGEDLKQVWDNPLRYRTPVHESRMYNAVDDEEQWVPKGRPNEPAEFWKWFSGDNSSIGRALDYFKYRTNLPGRSIEDYRGRGTHFYNNPNRPVKGPYKPTIDALQKIFSKMDSLEELR